MLVKYLPVQTAPHFPQSAYNYNMMSHTSMTRESTSSTPSSIQLPSMSHLLASTTSTSTSSMDTSSTYHYDTQSSQGVAGIMRRPKLTLSKEEFLAATSPQPSTSSTDSSAPRPKLTISREGLPYDAQGGAVMMLGMREALCQFSLALEHATTRQEQADIYFQRANLYNKYGLHAEALRDCNNSYYCFPSPGAVQLRNVIAKKFQAAQYEFNETGINILKEKLQHAMQERTSSMLRQC